MYLLTLLLMVPPPSEATLAEYAKQEPAFPAAAILHKTECGKTIGIVPEPLQERTVMVTIHGTCGMWCNCPRQWQEPRKIADNKRTPLAKIEEALSQIDLSKDDVLFDLGCGDGRVAVMAASVHGCRAVGLDNRPAAVSLSQRNAELNDVGSLLRFYERDVFRADLKDATVVFVYLDKSMMPQVADLLKLYPQITRAISYQHAWPRGGKKVGEFYIWKPQPKLVAKVAVCRY